MTTKQSQKTPEKEPPRPATVSLVDKAGAVQMRFLAREVRMSTGRVAAIKTGVATVRLTAGAGEIAVWGARSDEGPTAMITAEGYRKCNQIAGITVMTPSTIELADVGRVANPYVVTNEATGAFKAGWVRKIAVAPTPTGNLALCDRTTYLSLVEYLLEDLIGVAKKAPTACVWGAREMDPASLLRDAVTEANADLERRAKSNDQAWLRKYLTPPEELERAVKRCARPGAWAFLEVEPITGQGLWFDRTSEAVSQVLGTYVRTGKFGIRKLEAIGYRNVLADHPLMPKKKVAPERLNAVAEMVRDGGREREVVRDWWTDVQVFFHEQVEGEAEIAKVLRDYENGLRTGAYTVAAADPRPERAAKEDGDPDEDDAPRGDEGAQKDDPAGGEVERLDGDDEPAPASASTKSRPAPAPDERAALLAELRTIEEIAGKAIVARLLTQFEGIKRNRMTASIDEVRAYRRALESAINTRDAAR